MDKANDNQEEADSPTQYNKLYPTFVPNFKILGLVVPEKSLTKKKFTHTHPHPQTNIDAEKTKTIYPLYTSYTGSIMNAL